jgi:hypothetical protein
VADLLDGFARYLQDQGLVTYDPDGVLGDCFIDTMPPTPDSAVALGEYGLGEPDPANDDDVSGLQVRVRGGPDPRVSKTRCRQIYSALQGLSEVALPDGTWLILCTAQTTVSPLGVDATGRHEHVVNYRISVVSPTAHRS